MKKQESKEAKYLFTDLESYTYNQELESKVFKLFNELKRNAIDVLGQDYDINYKDYLNAPREYLVNHYFILSKRPKHLLDRGNQILTSDTGINLSALEKTHRELTRLMKSMSQMSPKIQKNGLKSTIRESLFHRYLDPNKADHYQAVRNFYQSAQSLTKFGADGSIHLMRFAKDGLWLEKGQIEINHSIFAE